MITLIWNSLIYQPLYNALIFFVSILPGHSVGVAIILLTIAVKIAMYPLTAKSIRAQQEMKKLEPLLRALRDKHKDNKQKLAESTMALYKEHKISPFSGCLPMLLQIPIIIALYFIVFSGLKEVDGKILYSFIQTPLSLDMQFLFFDLAGKSFILALLAGVTQYYQIAISLGKQEPAVATSADKKSFQEDFARTMQMQMRYVLPFIVGFFAYTTSAAVALFWIISNIFSIGQELLVKRSLKK